MLTIKEVVADILRCLNTHALNVIEGTGVPKLTRLSIRRRKIIRRDWLAAWVEANMSSKVQGLNW